MSSQPCILVLSNSEIPAGILREMLPRDSFPSVLFAASITAARRTLLAREVDLLVIDAPLQKESALGFAQEISQRSTPGLLLLMGADFITSRLPGWRKQAFRSCPSPFPRRCCSIAYVCYAPRRSGFTSRSAKRWTCSRRCRKCASSPAPNASCRNSSAGRKSAHTAICRSGPWTNAAPNTKQHAISYRN